MTELERTADSSRSAQESIASRLLCVVGAVDRNTYAQGPRQPECGLPSLDREHAYDNDVVPRSTFRWGPFRFSITLLGEATCHTMSIPLDN
jgi:hypothetical protein